MVRAKVAALRQQQLHSETAAQTGDYLHQASRWLTGSGGGLLLCTGLSGSGKSYLAGKIAPALPAVRLRSDVLRKTLAGLHPSANASDADQAGIYTPGQTEKVYAGLLHLADRLLAQSYWVILDATFLHRAERDAARAVAQKQGRPCAVLHCHAPDAVLESRIRARAQAGGDPSDADVSILHRQQQRFELPEGADVIDIDTSLDVDLPALIAKLRRAAPVPT
jgi:predicted kinase